MPPALLAQAIKLLKDNDISSPVRAQKVFVRRRSQTNLPPPPPDFGPENTAHGVPH